MPASLPNPDFHKKQIGFIGYAIISSSINDGLIEAKTASLPFALETPEFFEYPYPIPHKERIF